MKTSLETYPPEIGAVSVCVCVYTVITNGFSSFHCSCTILKSRGQRYPCHFLCQRSWVTCGKDIDQGRLIYVPAIVSTVDFLFLFMSCALFLRSWICVRWNSIARQLRKSGEDYDILHTFYWPLPHSVSWVFDLTWSHRRLVSTNQKVMSGHFPVFRVEYESPKPHALRVHFKRHMTESRFYTVKSNRSSHKAEVLVQFGQSRHKSKFPAPRVQFKCVWSLFGPTLSHLLYFNS